MIGGELEKTRGEDSPSLAEMKPRLIEHHVMAGGLGAQAHAKLVASRGELLQTELLKIV